MQFYLCEPHQKKVKLFCMTCNECVCVDCIGVSHVNHPVNLVIKRVEDIKEDCIGDFHSNHSTKSVLKRVEDIKEEWKKRVEEVANQMNNHLKVEILFNNIEKANEEIKGLEDALKNLIEKKDRMVADLINTENINQTTSYLNSFLQSLPPLPLSSFFSSSSINNMNNNKKVKTNNKNKMIFSNQLILNYNLVSHFGSVGSDPSTHFNLPHYLTHNDKLNIIAVSDYRNNRIKIMDKKGGLIRCFPLKSTGGIAIIPSPNLLAVSSAEKHVIEMFDLSPLPFA